MRRLSFVMGPVLLLAGAVILLAQHSGSHAPGGHASTSGTHFSHGAPASTTYSTLSNHPPLPGQAIYPTPIGLQHQYSGFTGINPGVLSNGNRRGGRYYGYGTGLWYPPLYLSTFDDSPTPYAYNNAQDPSAQYSDMNANALGEQVEQLSAEVEALRNERAASAYSPAYNAPANDPPTDNSSAAPVTLVTKSGKQLQLKNYAVMGQYIWDFSGQPAKRIAVSSLDLNASRVATEASGGEFPEIR